MIYQKIGKIKIFRKTEREDNISKIIPYEYNPDVETKEILEKYNTIFYNIFYLHVCTVN